MTKSPSSIEPKDFFKLISKGSTLAINQKLDEINDMLKKLAKIRKSIVFAIIYTSLTPIQREHVAEIFSEFKKVINNTLEGLRDDNSDINIDIIIHTLGGDADAAFHLGYIMQKYIEEIEKNRNLKIMVNVVIPRIAKSAGTLLALCGDKIILTRVSELGPIDPQIRSERGEYVSAKTMRDSLKQVMEIILELGSSTPSGKKENIEKAIKNILQRIPVTEMGHYESLMNHVSRLAQELLLNRMLRKGETGNIDQITQKICEKLVKGYDYHGYVLTYWHLKEMGIKCELIDDNIENLLLKLYERVKEIEEIVSAYMLPPLLSLPEFLIQHMYAIYQLNHGVVIVPTPKKIDEILERILEGTIEMKPENVDITTHVKT